MNGEILGQLRRRHEEQKDRLFPTTPPLPEKYSDLKVDWSDFDGFVAGLAERLLAGEPVQAIEIEPHSPTYRVMWRRLRNLATEYPEIAPTYVTEFEFLEGILSLIRSIVQGHLAPTS